MDHLTAAQARVLDAIRSRLDAGLAPPTYRELQGDLGFSSTASVRDHLRALERKGFLSLGEGRFRSVRLMRDTACAVRIPLLGRVVAGVPTPSQEDLDGFVEVPSLWIRGDTFAVRVVGDSMKDAGILDGDIAVLRRDLEPRPGQVVCATVEGDTTIKTFTRRRDGCWLMPANEAYSPIRLTDDSLLQGVLQVCVRLYGSAPGALTATIIPHTTHRFRSTARSRAERRSMANKRDIR
jgi:repressor LexA